VAVRGRAAKEPHARESCTNGTRDVRVDHVPEPELEDPKNLIIKVTSTAICGSDLHLYDGFLGPFMKEGQILGHEPMGEVVEVGSEVKKFKVGDRIVVPFTITCGDASSVERASTPAAT
jgi:threonine dehydrogenase-like Zn-dependent dehydrogenase